MYTPTLLNIWQYLSLNGIIHFRAKLKRTSALESLVDRYNASPAALYMSLGVSQYIIAVEQDNDEIRECMTAEILQSSSTSYLTSKIVTADAAVDYINANPGYEERVQDFLKKRM